MMTESDIFILEDDLTTRTMLRVVLEKAGYRPVFFADGESLLAKSRMASPVCILLDLCLPGSSGLDVLGQLNDHDCPAPILMVSGQGDIAAAVQALRIGAVDFVEKPFAPADLIARIEAACGFGPAHASGPVDDFKRRQGLTRRECEILDHLIAGSSSKVIARELGISPRTVEDHRSRIIQKAGVKTTAQLSILALGGGKTLKGRSIGSRSQPVSLSV